MPDMVEIPKDAKAYLTNAVKGGSSKRVSCERRLVKAALGAKADAVLATSRGNSTEYCEVRRPLLLAALEGGS